MRAAGIVRRALRLGVVVSAGFAALAVVAVGYLRTEVTVRDPVPHAVAGLGAAPSSDAVLGRLHLAPGFRATVYAQRLGPARVLRFTAGGDLLVSITRQGRVLLLERDADGDGRADGVRTLLNGLDRPHGIDVAGGWLYVAETGAVRRVRFDAAARAVGGELHTVATLPAGGMHFTRTLRVGPDGALYVSVGSSCNVCVETDARAALLRVDPTSGEVRRYAEGLRNTVGFDWQPGTGDLYGVDNGRDLLGDDYPPDELNRLVEGGFYGWPFWHADNRPDPEYGDHPAAAGRRPRAPAYAFGAHVAALSINFFPPDRSPPGFENAALVGQHGSWNRSELAGYRVSSLHWAADGRITERDFMVGFATDGQVSGRPVDALPGPDGAVYVSDDYAGAVYRVTWDAREAAPGPVFEPPRPY
ncbi:MAG: sorbosone dehydrogenase family protein [Immundisolibacter sp.]